MKKHHQVDEQEIARFNMMRINQLGKTYSQAEFQSILKRLGYSTSGTFRKCLIDANVFIRVERGKYSFPPKPVHMSLLQKAYDTCTSYKKQFRNKNEQTQVQEQEPQQLEVQQAIDLLKSLGYRVLRPTTQYEEV